MFAVTIYTTGPGCVRCTMTKRRLTQRGIEFHEVDVRENPAARDYLTEELGYTEAPVVVVEDGDGHNHWAGFRADKIDALATI